MYEIKCAMLVLEAALPIGCMYDVPEERSRPLKLRRDELPDWVKRVEAARTATEVGRQAGRSPIQVTSHAG